MKTRNSEWLVLVFVGSLLLLTGCGTTPGKVIAAASTSVDHAMQGWAVYVVNGHATPEQEAAVRRAHQDYLAAEDLALEAYTAAAGNYQAPAWQQAREILRAQERALLQLINMFQGGSP